MTTQYVVYGNEKSVAIWSNQLLPFEPKGWLMELRVEIQNQIKLLKSSSNKSLYAKFVSSKTDKVDLDNILFYNVAYSAFSHLFLDSIVMERSYLQPKPAPDGKYYNYYCYYSTEKPEFEHKRKKILGTFSSISLSNFSSETKVDKIWYSIKKGKIIPYEKNYKQPFGINISVTSSNLKLVSEVGIKRIIDASIESFQAHAGNDPEVFRRLAQNLSINQNEAKQLLCDESHAVLGKGDLLASYRNGIKWNPNDDLAVFISLNLKHGQESHFSISGEIFSVI